MKQQTQEMQARTMQMTMQMKQQTQEMQARTMQMQPDKTEQQALLDERMDGRQGQLQENKAEQQAQFHSEQMQAMEQRQAVRMQERQADMRAQMQDMRLQLRAERRKQWQETIQPELQTVQDTPAQLVQCEAQSNEEPSKHYPGKLATARLQRHALTLRANSRVKKKRVKQHRMTPL